MLLGPPMVELHHHRRRNPSRHQLMTPAGAAVHPDVLDGRLVLHSVKKVRKSPNPGLASENSWQNMKWVYNDANKGGNEW